MVWSMTLDCNLDFNPGNQNLVFKSSVLSDRQTFSFWITFLWNLIKFASVVFDLEKIVRVMPMTVNCDLNLCDGNFVGNTPFHFGTHFSGVWLKSLQLFLSYHRHTILYGAKWWPLIVTLTKFMGTEILCMTHPLILVYLSVKFRLNWLQTHDL